MTLNIELLQKVKEQIKGQSVLFNMGMWSEPIQFTDDFGDERCGTCMCIGGWAASIAGAQADVKKSSEYYGLVLGIENHTHGNLFFINEWPEPYRSRYIEAHINDNFTARANVGCEYIDWFIENHRKLR
jgi:hypothetical protein